MDLSLSEVNPPLARDIIGLETAIAEERQRLIDNAPYVADLTQRLDALKSLETELSDLSARSLDTVADTDLDEILDRYASVVSPATRAELVKVIGDLKTSVDELKSELGRLMGEWGKLATDTADLATKGARDAGWTADPPGAYSFVSDTSIPVIDVPPLWTGGNSDGSMDPYASYADGILKRLASVVRDGDVVDRTEFASIVSGWRRNQSALEKALRARASLSQQETNAFLAAQNRVMAEIRRHMDDAGWYKNNPVPPEVRQLVDGVLRRRFADMADDLKNSLNEMRGVTPTTREAMVIDTVGALGNGVSAVEGDPDDDFEAMASEYHAKVRGALEQARSFARLAVGGLASLLPGVGDGVDFCEAVTGRELCDDKRPPTLSLLDRASSALGALFGNRTFWRGVAQGASGAGAMVFARVAHVADHLADLTLVERKALRGRIGVPAVVSMEGLAGKEMVRLTDKFGELTVMQLAPHVKGAGLQELDELKFFERYMSPRTVDYARSHGAAVKAPNIGSGDMDPR